MVQDSYKTIYKHPLGGFKVFINVYIYSYMYIVCSEICLDKKSKPPYVKIDYIWWLSVWIVRTTAENV
jgi:hypothetical protein